MGATPWRFKSSPRHMVKVEILQKDTYLQMIENSIGSNLFRNVYALVGGDRQDILRDGDLSCAFFVSSILKQFELLEEVHVTVAGTVRDLENSGWQKTNIVSPGCVIVWGPREQAEGEEHSHMGFALTTEEAVSNSYKEKAPVRHPIHATGDISNRSIVAMYSHPFLTR